MIEQPEFDLFNLAPASAEASHSEVAVSGESTAASTLCFDAPTSVEMTATDGCTLTGGGSSPRAGASKPWNEVPQELFLSWSDAMQRAYMRARDLAGAATAHERGEDPEFYLQRAETYRA